jgi:hypothetical protein
LFFPGQAGFIIKIILLSREKSKIKEDNVRDKIMMANIDLLDKPIFKLPKDRDNDYFPEFMEQLFGEYRVTLKGFKGAVAERLKLEIKLIDSLVCLILKSITWYYKGYPASSYSHLKQALDWDEINEILPMGPKSMLYMHDQENLYRMRIEKNIDVLDRTHFRGQASFTLYKSLYFLCLNDGLEREGFEMSIFINIDI